VQRILLHVCCGPCASGVIPELRRLGYEPTALLFNPNIHPLPEFQLRRESALKVLDELCVERVIADDYNQADFLTHARTETGKRCGYCYRTRLGRAAREAEKLGLVNYTTTLTISPWQDHELIITTGKQLQEKHSVLFQYFDFRPQYGFARTQTFKLELYRQKYCGCLLSREESLMEK
jgi:predicted adenine nucleotide alpha hydrolase (AANH) superfamily ATPase